MSMRALLEGYPEGQRLYVFTTEGHVHVGVISNLIDDVVFLTAPGGTPINLNLSDISGARPYVDEPEEAQW